MGATAYLTLLTTLGALVFHASSALAGGIDPAMADEMNANSFLERCTGAKAVAEFVAVGENGPQDARCAFGDCPSPLSNLLAKGSLPDFYEQHCCLSGQTHLYVALFEDGRKDWTYLMSKRIPDQRFAESCK